MITYRKLIGEGVTDSNGECGIEITGEHAENLNIQCDVPNLNLEEDTEILIIDPDVITSIELTGEPDIIQSGETSEIYATGFNNGGLPVEDGHTIYFFEKISPVIDVSASASIIQTNDNVELYAKVKDDDGSLAQDVKVHFYEFTGYDEIPIWIETGYQTDYYPTPLIITGEMKKNGSWGGLRIYGDDNNHHYVYLGQGSVTNDENAKIFYKFTDNENWSSFKITIGNGSISLYVNDTLIQTVSTDTSKAVSIWGGSNTNRVSVRNVKIRIWED